LLERILDVRPRSAAALGWGAGPPIRQPHQHPAER